MLRNVGLQAALACSLSFLGGATFWLSVFTLPVEHEAALHPSLAGVWAPACGAIYYLSSMLMIPCPLHLSNTPSRPRAVRALLLAAATAFLSFAAAGPGVQHGWRLIVIAAVTAVGVPLGLFSVLSIDHIALWCPRFFAPVVGFSSVTFGMGTILAASLFHYLVDARPVSCAIVEVSFLGATLTLALTGMLRFPDVEADTVVADVATNPRNGELNTEDASLVPKLSFNTMVRARQFFLFVLVVVATCAPFPILPYFFILGTAHDASQLLCLRVYQVGTAASIAFNLTSAWMCDVFRTRSGEWSIGVRNVLLCTMTVQTAGFAILTMFDAQERFVLWAVLVTVECMFYLAGFSLAALLAGDIFGRRNAALVLGVGGGLALGVGEALAAALMLVVDVVSPGHGSPGHFQSYYVAATVWSSLGLFALVPLRRVGGLS